MSRRGIEIKQGVAHIYGAPTDVHMHPRIFDPRFPGLPEIPNGKAGVDLYTATALRGGIQRGLFMPNETLRLYNPDSADQTETHPYPITTQDRLLAALNVAESQSFIMAGIIMGVDPETIGLGSNNPRPRFTTHKIKEVFRSEVVQTYTAALKIYGAETTGGFNIPLDSIIPVAEVWDKYNHGKPVILHLEDADVGRVLEDWPAHIAVHVAHISSQEELEAVMEAKDQGVDVTCEATPHHLFLTEKTRHALSSFGCMKPSLKKPSDVKFLWDNLDYIDIFASDCAPHRLIDKVDEHGHDLPQPAFGVTNHDVFLPLFFGAIMQGRLTEQELYQRIVTNPATRFNLPELASVTQIRLNDIDSETLSRDTPYGVNPFTDSPETPAMVGPVTHAFDHMGRFVITASRLTDQARTRPQNLIRF